MKVSLVVCQVNYYAGYWLISWLVSASVVGWLAAQFICWSSDGSVVGLVSWSLVGYLVISSYPLISFGNLFVSLLVIIFGHFIL